MESRRATTREDHEDFFNRIAGRSEELRETERPAADTSISAPGLQRQKRGRKKTGKRSNPEWELISAYMRKSTYRRVRRVLLDHEPKMNFSDLIEGLCTEWLAELEEQP
jgi:hypothetical protein